tara:strand:- start:3756 stop:4598 length:843 start_codon:yes stop_codon:yes gene_type:complete
MKILHPLAKRFIAGFDFDSAKPVVDKLMEDGYEVSLDYLGELSSSVGDCHRAKDQYIDIINFYKDKNINISIKPTQLGLSFMPSLAFVLLEDIAKQAVKYDHTIRLDMEDSSVTEQTINLCNAMKELKLNNTGIALQSNLFRTPKDLLKLTENKVSIRLVKGAYVENQEIAHQKDFEIGAAFFDCAAHLYSHKAHKPAIATHDEELLEDIEELIPQPNYFEYELLYGIRRDLQEELKNKGYTVRIYVPFGKDWLPYTTRRLKEWKNLKFVIRNIFKEWKK